MPELRCPDCGCDPDDDTLHRADCRRVLPTGHPLERLQFGPPYEPWPVAGADGLTRGVIARTKAPQ